MAITFNHLGITGYEVEKIETLQISGKVNEHTHLKLKALIRPDQKVKDVHETGQQKWIELYALEESKKTTLFHGVVTKVQVHVLADVYTLELEAKSGSYLLDIQKKSRSFQDCNETYGQIIAKILKDYPHADCNLQIQDKPTGQLIIQYEETDWAFIKRLLSHFYEGLLPASEYEGIKFFGGVPQIEDELLEIGHIHFEKNLKEYYETKKHGLADTQESHHMSYLVTTYGLARLGHATPIGAKTFYVRAFTWRLEESLLVATYELRLKKGLRQPKQEQNLLIGTALEGKILVSQADQVKVHLQIDEKQDTQSAYWFPYSTLSASTDGSGWYCMPEVGDAVRVYFPTKQSKDAFAISSVNTYNQPQGEDRMANPDVKYLRTVHDKEVKLAPECIRIACNGNKSVVTLQEDGAISLYGSQNIEIKAEETIVLDAKEDLMMTALEGISFSCDKGARLELDERGNIVLKGTEVKID
jgi:hypothetical protein